MIFIRPKTLQSHSDAHNVNVQNIYNVLVVLFECVCGRGEKLTEIDWKDWTSKKEIYKNGAKHSNNIAINNNKYELEKTTNWSHLFEHELNALTKPKTQHRKIFVNERKGERRAERIKNFFQWKWETKSTFSFTFTCIHKHTRAKGEKTQQPQQVCVMQTSTRTIEQSHQTYQHQQQFKQKETITIRNFSRIQTAKTASAAAAAASFAFHNVFLCMHLVVCASKMRRATIAKNICYCIHCSIGIRVNVRFCTFWG